MQQSLAKLRPLFRLLSSLIETVLARRRTGFALVLPLRRLLMHVEGHV